VKVELFGSLGFTGKGHNSDKAIVMGLEGETPATIEVDTVAKRVAAVTDTKRIKLLGTHEVDFDPETALIFHRREKLPLHSNGMRFTAVGANGAAIVERIFYSVAAGSSSITPARPRMAACRPSRSRCRTRSTPPTSCSGSRSSTA